MTFSSAPWAIDGAKTGANLARRATYAAVGDVEGLVTKTDLKVSQLAVPGNGLLISGGNAIVLNRYQQSINESYVVANPDTHQVLPVDMPAVSATAKSYLVLVTIGDPEFSQVGHPWMTSDKLSEDEAPDYVYARPFLLPCNPGTTSAAGLGLTYPAYALARLDIPANTATITDSMLTDLRKMARPRVSEEVFFARGGTANPLNTVTPAFETWGGAPQSVAIPKWATLAKIDGWVESAIISKATIGDLRVNIVGRAASDVTPFNRSTPANGTDRTGMNFGGKIDVTAVAGSTRTIQLEGRVASAASSGGLTTDGYTSMMIRVRFEEIPV